MPDYRDRWALILGASSGMGEATARALAARRLQDRRDPSRLPGRAARVEELKAELAETGSEVLYINMNAADDEKRAAALDELGSLASSRRAPPVRSYVRVVMHSLAFGSLVPFITDDPKAPSTARRWR